MADDICILLGHRIRKLRRAKGWRQVDLAQHAGIHVVHISDLERGTREVGLRTLLSLTRALSIKLAEIMEGLD